MVIDATTAQYGPLYIYVYMTAAASCTAVPYDTMVKLASWYGTTTCTSPPSRLPYPRLNAQMRLNPQKIKFAITNSDRLSSRKVKQTFDYWQKRRGKLPDGKSANGRQRRRVALSLLSERDAQEYDDAKFYRYSGSGNRSC